MDSATRAGTMWWWLCRRRFLPRVSERVATVVIATARIAVAAQIDLLYSPVGANVRHHLIHGSVSPYLPPPKKNFPFLQILPAVAFLFFFRADYMDSPDCLLVVLSISVFLLLSFSVLHFLVVGSVR